MSFLDSTKSSDARRPDRRFPRSVYSIGAEPDPRYSLANERTFLAWLQTSIGLIAAGVALEALAAPVQPGLRLAASIILIVAGIIVPAQAWWGWVGPSEPCDSDTPFPRRAWPDRLRLSSSLRACWC